MFRSILPRAAPKSVLRPASGAQTSFRASNIYFQDRLLRRGYASESGLLHLANALGMISYADLFEEEKDLVIIGGGVAGYVAAIKAGQAGLKVCLLHPQQHATSSDWSFF